MSQIYFQLKIGDVCISLTHRPASIDATSKASAASTAATNDSGEMRPPPVPTSDRERHRSRSSSPLTSASPKASSKLVLTSSSSSTTSKPTRLSPLKQVAFSDKIVLHSPTKNDAKHRFDDDGNDVGDIKVENDDDDQIFDAVVKSEVDGENKSGDN